MSQRHSWRSGNRYWIRVTHMSYERDTERNHCCVCGKQLHSATFIGEWGCDCGDRELHSYRACAKCHSEHHSADNMTNYDPNYFDEETDIP